MKITDEMLFEHAAQARDIWLNTFPDNSEIPEFHCSDAFERNMKKLLKEQRRAPNTNKILRCMKQTVAAVLAVVVISFGGLMTAEAYREKVIEIVVHVFHEFTYYRFSSEKSDLDEIVLPEISFEYVPDGMREVEDRITGTNRRYILYERENGTFFELTQCPITAGGSYGKILDTEDSAYETTNINGNEAFSNVKDGNAIIFWTYNNVVYDLYGNLDLTELKEIAENIKMIER